MAKPGSLLHSLYLYFVLLELKFPALQKVHQGLLNLLLPLLSITLPPLALQHPSVSLFSLQSWSLLSLATLEVLLKTQQQRRREEEETRSGGKVIPSLPLRGNRRGGGGGGRGREEIRREEKEGNGYRGRREGINNAAKKQLISHLDRPESWTPRHSKYRFFFSSSFFQQ